MSYSPPEPPSPPKKSLDLDEFAAVVVAFIGIGLILLWGLSRKQTSFGAAALRLLGEPSRVEATASGDKSSGEPSSKLSSLEDSEQDSPFQIFQRQPNTPDKIAKFSHSESLGFLSGQLPSQLSRRATESSSKGAQTGRQPSSTESDGAVQPDGNEFGLSVPGTEAAPIGGELPILPSQPLEPALESPAALPIPTVPKDFPDVPDDYWAMEFIDALSARGLLSGFPDGTFRPDKPVTRAELAAQIAKVFPLEDRGNALDFSDLPENYWANSVIQETVAAGFMRGYPQETFKPDQAVTRLQVFVAIVSGLKSTPSSPTPAIFRRYQDWQDIPNWALSKVTTATEMGLVVNYPNLEWLQPNKAATRAEVAAIMNRALVYQGKLDDSSSSYIVRP